MNRIEKAVNYALNTLEQHLPERFLYHSLHHTCNVIKYSGVFAQQSGLCQHEQEIIRVAAAFHDIGYVKNECEHEHESAVIAQNVLPEFGFNANEIDEIGKLILATKLPCNPQTNARKILCDADVEYVGRSEFYRLIALFRQELLLGGYAMSEVQWLEFEVKYLENFRFFTPVAGRLRSAGLKRHLNEMRHSLEVIRNSAEEV